MIKSSLLVVGANHRSSTAAMRRRMLPLGADGSWLIEEARKADLLPLVPVVADDCIVMLSSAETACDQMNLRMRLMALLVRQDSMRDEGIFALWGREALYHLFSMAAGLESLVMGDDAVTIALQDGVQLARMSDALQEPLVSMIDYALAFGASWHRNGEFGKNPSSLAKAAVTIIEEVHGTDEKLNVLLLESSPLALLIGERIATRAHEVTLASYDGGVAESYVRRTNGRAVPFDSWRSSLRSADVVLLSSLRGEGPFVLDDHLLRQVMRHRRGRPLLMMDMTVPSLIDPSAYDVDGVYVCDLSDLEERLLHGADAAGWLTQGRQLAREAVHDFLADEPPEPVVTADSLLWSHWQSLRNGYGTEAAVEQFLRHPLKQLRALESKGRGGEARKLIKFLFLQDQEGDIKGDINE